MTKSRVNLVTSCIDSIKRDDAIKSILLETPKGKGFAHFVIDYSQEHNLLWVVFSMKMENVGHSKILKYEYRVIYQ